MDKKPPLPYIPSPQFFKIVFRLSLILNIILVPTVFLKDHVLYYLRHNPDHQWVTQPILKSNLYRSLFAADPIKKDQILKLYQLMKDVHEIFEKSKLTYWIESGTLLGAVRHRGLIPWDDDLDISIRLEDSYRFQNLIPEFEKLGYQIDESYFGFKIYLIENKDDRLHNVCCDVFTTVMDGEKILYSSPGARKFWSYYFINHDLFPLKKYKFGEVDVWGPQTPEPYLTLQYGNWKTIAYQGPRHLSHEEGSTVPFTPTDKDLEPGKPTGPLKDRV